MRAISGKEFVSTIERHGWVLLRIHGSHHIYVKAGTIVRLSVPIHGNRPLKVGLLKHLLKMAGLEENDLNGT